MSTITLQELLEAGCHFGHKSERWHPKATEFIYTEKDGIHIIDLAKTKAGLDAAYEFVQNLTAQGGEVMFVGTKRQAKTVVREAAVSSGAPYLVERWIGGFLTNWDSIKANITKINRMDESKATGGWKKYPKHEQVKMDRYLTRIKVYYGGVLTLKDVPQALFVVDVRKEISAVREAVRRGLPIVAIVDTNADPSVISYPIPANDDAVGSVKLIVSEIAKAYAEGKADYTKKQADAVAAAEQKKKTDEATAKNATEAKKPVIKPEAAKPVKKAEAAGSVEKKAAAKAVAKGEDEKTADKVKGKIQKEKVKGKNQK